MKKIVVGLFLFAITLCLAGCETPSIIDKDFKVEVTGSTDSLMEPIKSSYKAGAKVEIKAYPVTDVGLYVFIDNEQVPMSHYDSDYWGYEFIMPEKDITIHLTYDQFYGKDEYTFKDLYNWVDELDNVDKVAIYNKNFTFESFSEIYYITDALGISYMLDILNQPLKKYDLIESDRPQDDDLDIIPIEFHTTIIYYVGEQCYELNFTNNMLYWNDFSLLQRFKFKDANYLVPNTSLEYALKTYKFEYNGFSSDIREYGDESVCIRYAQIDSVEFVPYNGPLLDAEPTYYIDSRYGEIKLHTETIFELNDQYYEIISGVDYWAYKYLQLGNR